MGEELALGFAITTLFHEEPASAPGGMRPGDVLILTKAVGVGTLFAGHARLQAKGRWIDEALRSMQRSNRLAAKCLREHLATACSKVHGRGILGHLIEMARPSGVDAQINLDQLPVLDGPLETGAAGSVDARQVANLRLRDALLEPPAAAGHRHYALLFDPQIAGGLLASVARRQRRRHRGQRGLRNRTFAAP